jgi:hypothetical protein
VSCAGSTLTPVTRSTPSMATISTITAATTSTGAPGPRETAYRRRVTGLPRTGTGRALGSAVATLAEKAWPAARTNRRVARDASRSPERSRRPACA